MTDPDRLDRRAQLAVLLDRADRLTVDEAALLRTLVVAELATTPVRITGDPMPQPQACDASVISHLTNPPAMIGPCVLRHGHDGPLHKAASGASWVAQHRFTVAPHDPEAERAATERAMQAAADSEMAAAWHRKVTSGSADGPLVLDRAAAVVMRDCLNQLLGDAPAAPVHLTVTPQEH